MKGVAMSQPISSLILYMYASLLVWGGIPLRGCSFLQPHQRIEEEIVLSTVQSKNSSVIESISSSNR